jgi:hypothetical protein
MLIPVMEKHLKVRFCRLWKEFPNLLVFEVAYQEDGQFTDLFVFNLSASEPKQVFHFTVSENYIRREHKTGDVERVRRRYTAIFESRQGLPQIRIKETGETWQLNL